MTTRTYLLPEPTEMERRLLRRLSGSSKDLAEWKVFPSGEVHVRVRGVARRACVIGRAQPPAENLWRTLLLVDTLKRNGAKDITLLLPYFAYARQDRSTKGGDPVSAACLARLLASAGAKRIVCLDLHSRRIMTASPVSVRSASAMPDMAGSLASELRGRVFCVVAPDFGGRERAEVFARMLGLKGGVVWIEKHRRAGRVSARRIAGGKVARTAVIVDDILDTGSTVAAAVKLLKKHGCREFFLCVVHPVFSAGASRLVRKLDFRRILVSDALEAPADLLRYGRVKIIGCADILARSAA